jgi:hypothetical protein
MIGIYKITNPNGRVYIGQSRCIRYRWQNHSKKSNTASIVSSSIQKYGIENHTFSVVHQLPDDVEQSVLDDYERLYICQYRDCGAVMMNIRAGGHSGCVEYDLSSEKFGRLVVLCRDYSAAQTSWRCVCECGTIKTIEAGSLRSGKTRSCGCYDLEVKRAKARHGHSSLGGKKSLTYSSWASLIQRASDVAPVCEAWLVFDNFLTDMGERPSKGHCLLRQPNHTGKYEPGNCIWATRKQFCRSKKNNTWLECGGVRMILQDWADFFGVKPDSILYHFSKGRKFDDIVYYLSKPIITKRRARW